jgi:beta-lactamase class A
MRLPSVRRIPHLSDLVLIFVLAYSSVVSAKQTKDQLRHKIETIAKDAHGVVGVAMECLEDNDTLSLNGSKKFPMQSVYKFPIAMTLLHEVDLRHISLDSLIVLDSNNLLEGTMSPMRDKYPQGNVRLPIREIMRYMVSESDNNACDILFDVLGGPKKVEQYVRSIGVKGIDITKTEDDMHRNWYNMFRNSCKPNSMLQLLSIFYRRTSLLPSSSDLLMSDMIQSNTPKRIAKYLPASTIVAHKSGTSGYSKQHKISGATNDIGIITLPNGKHIALVVYVSMSKRSDDMPEQVIGHIAKAIWGYYAE